MEYEDRIIEQNKFIRPSIRLFGSIALFKDIKNVRKIKFFTTYEDLFWYEFENSINNIKSIYDGMDQDAKDEFDKVIEESCCCST